MRSVSFLISGKRFSFSAVLGGFALVEVSLGRKFSVHLSPSDFLWWITEFRRFRRDKSAQRWLSTRRGDGYSLVFRIDTNRRGVYLGLKKIVHGGRVFAVLVPAGRDMSGWLRLVEACLSVDRAVQLGVPRSRAGRRNEPAMRKGRRAVAFWKENSKTRVSRAVSSGGVEGGLGAVFSAVSRKGRSSFRGGHVGWTNGKGRGNKLGLDSVGFSFDRRISNGVGHVGRFYKDRAHFIKTQGGQDSDGLGKIRASHLKPSFFGPRWVYWRYMHKVYVGAPWRKGPGSGSLAGEPSSSKVTAVGVIQPPAVGAKPRVIFPPLIVQSALLVQDKIVFGKGFWKVASGGADECLNEPTTDVDMLSGGQSVLNVDVQVVGDAFVEKGVSESQRSVEGEFERFLGSESDVGFFDGDGSRLLSIGDNDIFSDEVLEVPMPLKETELLQPIMEQDDRQPQAVLDTLGLRLISHSGRPVEVNVKGGMRVFSRRRGKNWEKELRAFQSTLGEEELP